MQKLGNLAPDQLSSQLKAGQLSIRVGPYVYRLQSNIATVQEGLSRLYSDFPLAPATQFIDFDIALQCRNIVDRVRGQCEFLFDQQTPFDVIPLAQAYAFLEWGMNWCVSIHCNEYLKLHAAVVAKNGAGIVMPGIPGAGKSTLCAALGLRGWRVLSDEHALVPPGTTDLVPLPRPVSLKNESIDVIKTFSNDATFGPLCHETHKGTVAHVKADKHADSHSCEPVPARIMLFPRYSADEPQQLSARRRADSFVVAAYHSFNYSVLGESGFYAMKKLIDNVECFDLVYNDLDWAIEQLDGLLQ